ncbi:hypothetical protein Tco_0955826 [Tanacetum coccineum]|uniref:Uncharacterized protein n=1 Tax=Tanacetum coccineum TaxID=301880 RepID=A0ABQ5E8F2_9ASTR
MTARAVKAGWRSCQSRFEYIDEEEETRHYAPPRLAAKEVTETHSPQVNPHPRLALTAERTYQGWGRETGPRRLRLCQVYRRRKRFAAEDTSLAVDAQLRQCLRASCLWAGEVFGGGLRSTILLGWTECLPESGGDVGYKVRRSLISASPYVMASHRQYQAHIDVAMALSAWAWVIPMVAAIGSRQVKIQSHMLILDQRHPYLRSKCSQHEYDDFPNGLTSFLK